MALGTNEVASIIEDTSFVPVELVVGEVLCELGVRVAPGFALLPPVELGVEVDSKVLMEELEEKYRMSMTEK